MHATRLLSSAFALVLAGAASLAFAQQDALVAVEDDEMIVQPFNLSVDAIEDMDVIVDGDDVGDVEEVLATADGTVTAVAAEVGGFLGVGERDVIIPLDRLTLQDDDLVLDMTREEIEALPTWDD